MEILQEITKSNWIATVKFGAFSFTDGHGPYYLAGDFNNWKVQDDEFKIKQPPHRGSNTLADFIIELPVSIKSFEFKIWDSYSFLNHDHWVEPKFINEPGSVYENYNNVVSNSFGTLNLIVNQMNA